MQGLKIRDGTELGGPGGLEFGLAKGLVALGRVGAKSRWSCADLNYVSKDDQSVPVLERAETPGHTVSGVELSMVLGNYFR